MSNEVEHHRHVGLMGCSCSINQGKLAEGNAQCYRMSMRCPHSAAEAPTNVRSLFALACTHSTASVRGSSALASLATRAAADSTPGHLYRAANVSFAARNLDNVSAELPELRVSTRTGLSRAAAVAGPYRATGLKIGHDRAALSSFGCSSSSFWKRGSSRSGSQTGSKRNEAADT